MSKIHLIMRIREYYVLSSWENENEPCNLSTNEPWPPILDGCQVNRFNPCVCYVRNIHVMIAAALFKLLIRSCLEEELKINDQFLRPLYKLKTCTWHSLVRLNIWYYCLVCFVLVDRMTCYVRSLLTLDILCWFCVTSNDCYIRCYYICEILYFFNWVFWISFYGKKIEK